MFKTALLYVITPVAIGFLTLSAYAEDLTVDFETRHAECLAAITEDPELAFEEAMIWRDDGGGRRARHCIAMALFALKHTEEAATRLDALAEAPDGGTKEMRVDFRAEAANFWLVANKAKNAIKSATAGLEILENDVALRIARARGYALAGRYDFAETDLTSALVFEPENADVFRYRADAYFNMGKLEKAQADIEQALKHDPQSVETALLRGQINEKLRKTQAEPEASPDTSSDNLSDTSKE